MVYYRKRRYRSWRSRGWSGSFTPSKYAVLSGLFGSAVGKIRQAFMDLDEDARDELLSDYGAIYGQSAERYARKTFPNWKSGATNLSGQTMERLIELVPPYLSPEQRFDILQSVLRHHRKTGTSQTIKINVKAPEEGFVELQQTLTSMSHDDILAHLPEHVMEAASWLYDDDITAARAMLAEAERRENDLIRANAKKEIELLKRTISTGQVQTASYSVEMPAGKLNVIAFNPSQCFIATACFGENASETVILRQWRDQFLIKSNFGILFTVWYYKYGKSLAKIITKSPVLMAIAKTLIGMFAKTIACELNRGLK